MTYFYQKLRLEPMQLWILSKSPKEVQIFQSANVSYYAWLEQFLNEIKY